MDIFETPDSISFAWIAAPQNKFPHVINLCYI